MMKNIYKYIYLFINIMIKTLFNWLFNRVDINCSNCGKKLNLKKKFVNKLNFCNKSCSYNVYKQLLLLNSEESSISEDEQNTLL